jgi:L-ascorbate metabolism protein UlaG (beta-lactamase superfamily)
MRGRCSYRRMANLKYSGPPSDHFDGTRFFTPGHIGDKSQLDLLKWSFGEKRAVWPKAFPSPHVHRPQPRVSGLCSTLLGHASFLVQVDGLNVLIDPVFAERASPFQFAGPKRVNAPGVAFDDLPDIDAVLLTHNHYDHLDKQTLWQIEKRWQPQFMAPLGVDADVAQRGARPSRMVTLDWGQSQKLLTLTIHAVPTYHWSARGLGDRRHSLWCSFVIETARGVVYHIGDTGYGAGQFSRDVKARFGAPLLAHIPIGAYAPRWFMKDFHCNPEEALQIFRDCDAAHAIGHHWGTFQLTNEPIEEPAQNLAVLAGKAGLSERFQAFRPGQALAL